MTIAVAALGLALQPPPAPAASATHTRLVFALGKRLMASTPQGGGIHRIGTAQRTVYDMSAAENGHRIAVITNKQVPFPGKGSVRAIYLYRAGQGMKLVKRLKTEGDTKIAMSHDGRTLAFGKDNEIWVMPATGGRARRVTNGSGSNAFNPAFGSNDKTLVFSRATRNSPSVYRVPLSGGTEHRISQQGMDAISESVSTQGLVVFRQQRSGGPELLRVMKENGSGVHTVARSDDPVFDLDPDFAPNGRSIAFVRLREVNGDRSPRRYAIRTVRTSGAHEKTSIAHLSVRPRGLSWTRVP
jgi:dipeptidyl aminopeptidase/acylaminoacyl peptidase